MTQRTKFRCGKCNYMFFRDAPPKICPYCAKPGIMREDTFFNLEKEIEQA